MAVSVWHARVRPGVGQDMDASHGMDTATAVERWRLEPHPEGGYFRETYRSGLRTVPDGWPGERALATAILYLLLGRPGVGVAPGPR